MIDKGVLFMNNLAYRTYKTEDLRVEFIEKGFSEAAVDFILFHNDNSHFEVLKEKMNSLEQQMINIEKNLQKDIRHLDLKIDNVEKSLQKDIANLDIKIDHIRNEVNARIDILERNLQKDVSNLEKEIKNNKDLLLERLNTGNRIIHFMIIAVGILSPIIFAILNKFFIN